LRRRRPAKEFFRIGGMAGEYQRKNSGFHGNKTCARRILKTEGAKKGHDFIRVKMMGKGKCRSVSEEDHVVR
jgi:hypothetical protein